MATNPLIGPYRKIERGYARDPYLRWRAASGGVVSATLLHLLRTGEVDGCLVSIPDGTGCRPHIATTMEEVKAAMGSRYVLPGFSEILRAVDEFTGTLAAVGVPCQIRMLRSRDQIRYRIGLACSHAITAEGVDAVLTRCGIEGRDRVDYRGYGWPSGIRVDGTMIPNQNSIWSETYGNYLYCPPRCLRCTDHANEYADISVMDAWGVQDGGDGCSYVITRTPAGERLLQTAPLHLTPASASDVIRSQKFPLMMKKRNLFRPRTAHRLLAMNARNSPLIAGLPISVLAKYRQHLKREVLEPMTANIAIINSHGNNRGDEAAHRGLIHGIRSVLPDARITVLTRDMLDLPAGIEVKPPSAGTIAAANIVLSAPGGPYIGDLYSSHEVSEHLKWIAVSRTLRKPVGICAPSIGPFGMTDRNPLRRFLLNQCEFVSVRDPISRDHLRTLGVNGIHTADLAFLVPPPVPASTGERVGFTPAGARWNGVDEERYVDEIARFLSGLERPITIFPQLYGLASDLPLIERIRERVEGDVTVFPQDRNAEEQMAAIGGMSLFIGNRYHSCVFALTMGVPVVCVAYEHKATGVMRMFGLDEYTVDVQRLSAETLGAAAVQADAHRDEIREQIQERLPAVRARAGKNLKLILEMV